jgi:3-oxoacyl-[acyl-carrier protein] reductase
VSDRYLNFVNSPFGSTVASRVGLPQPAKLRRYSAGDPLLPGPAVLGSTGG